MFCIDWYDDDLFEILGSDEDDDHTRVEVVLVPCNYLHTQFGYDGDSISPECIGDLEE